MPTLNGEISRSEPGRLHEQLQGTVWLAQDRGKWPVTILTSEAQVISHLKLNREAVAWEYKITPVRRVTVEVADPVLVPHPGTA